MIKECDLFLVFVLRSSIDVNQTSILCEELSTARLSNLQVFTWTVLRPKEVDVRFVA